MKTKMPFFSRRCWVAIYQIICDRHGMDEEKLRALTPEAFHILVEEALRILDQTRKRKIRLQFNGSQGAYNNDKARRAGFKNSYEQRKANWKFRGFARPQDYYNDWAQRQGFADFWHYRKHLKEEQIKTLLAEVQEPLQGGR